MTHTMTPKIIPCLAIPGTLCARHGKTEAGCQACQGTGLVSKSGLPYVLQRVIAAQAVTSNARREASEMLSVLLETDRLSKLPSNLDIAARRLEVGSGTRSSTNQGCGRLGTRNVAHTLKRA